MSRPLSSITTEDLAFFSTVVGVANVYSEEEVLNEYATDETEDYVFRPNLALQPKTTKEISQIMSYCNKQHIPVTPRGAGTGLSGGALPVQGGVVMDLRRMNRILKIDTDNFQVTTEPGVITEQLQDAVEAHGLFYPVDPASRGSCFIGGNIAENSGGPRAVKYGTVKDYVLNLEVVLPDGSVVWTGANTLKNATGYQLTQLIVGSEGTLGIITKIVLKLVAAPTERLLLLVPFLRAPDACRAVNRVMKSGIVPSAMEFMERSAFICAMEYLDDFSLDTGEEIQAHLLIEVDGQDRDLLFKDVEKINLLLEEFATGPVLFADTAAQKQKLWRLRRVVGEATKQGSVYKEEDTVVPRACLPELLNQVKKIGNKYGFQSVCYGHAGDGNLHVNILKGALADRIWEQEIPKAIREIFTFVHSVHGTLSGEHGIGYVQKPFMDIVFDQQQLDIMKRIKACFDPNGILNPGKLFTMPEASPHNAS